MTTKCILRCVYALFQKSHKECETRHHLYNYTIEDTKEFLKEIWEKDLATEIAVEMCYWNTSYQDVSFDDFKNRFSLCMETYLR